MDIKNLFSCRKGFTLAEVLVTLGIIGVVSAMTLPTLVKNHQRKVYVTQLHKVYNEVQQAVDMYVTDNNYVSLGESRLRNNPEELRRFIHNYFKIAKDCETHVVPCWAEEYSSLNGEITSHKNALCNIVVTLADGAAICFDVAAMEDVVVDEDNFQESSYGKYGNNSQLLTVECDINGKQGPNVYGRDAFQFSVNASGQIIDQDYINNNNEANLNSKWISNGTFGKIMNEGWEMNY